MAARAQTAVERAHGAAITEAVGGDEIDRLSVPNGVDSVVHLAVIWVEILALFGVVALIGPLPLPLTVPVRGGRRRPRLDPHQRPQRRAMHEASHGFLFRDRKTNDRVCKAAASWWMFHSVEEYRPTHRLHHRYLNGPEDPDLPSYLIPSGSGRLARLLALDLLGVTALRRAFTLVSTMGSHEAGQARLSPSAGPGR